MKSKKSVLAKYFGMPMLLALALLAGLSLVISGCSGGDTDGGSAGGGEVGFDDDVFVDSDGAAGGIRLEIIDDTLQVSQISGFIVTVFDANGNPVPQIRVACDTEQNLALIEPLSGFELTDSFGAMSGKVGCEAEGSFQIGCRLPVGGNKRAFKTIKCSGPTPVGFEGFPQSGGGGLGGGVGGTDDAGPGGTNPDGVRIVSVVSFDDGSIDSTFGSGATDLSIDVLQGACSATAAEPFFDTVFGVDVQNNTNSSINFSSFNYTVRNADGAGSSFTSSTIALTNADEVSGSGGDGAGKKRFLALGFDAANGFKYFYGSATPIPSDLGFRNVTLRLFGTSATGESITLTKTLAFSFGNFNRC